MDVALHPVQSAYTAKTMREASEALVLHYWAGYTGQGWDSYRIKVHALVVLWMGWALWSGLNAVLSPLVEYEGEDIVRVLVIVGWLILMWFGVAVYWGGVQLIGQMYKDKLHAVTAVHLESKVRPIVQQLERRLSKKEWERVRKGLCVGKKGQGQQWSQEECNMLWVLSRHMKDGPTMPVPQAAKGNASGWLLLARWWVRVHHKTKKAVSEPNEKGSADVLSFWSVRVQDRWQSRWEWVESQLPSVKAQWQCHQLHKALGESIQNQGVGAEKITPRRL